MILLANLYIRKSVDIWYYIHKMKELIKYFPNGQWKIESLNKVGEGYKRLVEDGIALLHPVTVEGRPLSDDGIPYHATIKAFNKDKDSIDDAHGIANQLKMDKPDASKVFIQPHIFKDRFGDDVHVLTMHGEDADKIIQNYHRFTGMGWLPRPEGYRPHITIDESTYNKALQSGAKTAADLGIQFGDAELRRGFQTVSRYPTDTG